MKIISPRIHGILDYVVVVAFLAAPTALGLSGRAATLSWALAAVHLALTLVTAFPAGVVKLVPLRIHGWVELVVGPTLVAVPWILGFSHAPVEKGFYTAAGAVIFVTWIATDYRAAR